MQFFGTGQSAFGFHWTIKFEFGYTINFFNLLLNANLAVFHRGSSNHSLAEIKVPSFIPHGSLHLTH